MLRLRPRAADGGFSLVELMIVVALAAVLALLASPSIGNWMANARVRTVAESLQNDIRMAQVEAVRQSRSTVFALTAAAPAFNAAPAQDGRNWYVRVQPLVGSDEVASSASLVTMNSSAPGYGVNVRGPALTCFGALGQLITVGSAATGLGTECNAANPVTYTVSHANANRALSVLVYLGGRVFMCDRAKTLSATNPDGCPT